MWNNYQPFRGGIRFFPHIVPIGFPLIFPFGIWLSFKLFHLLFPFFVVLVIAGAVFFLIRTVQLGSASAAWNSILGMLSPLQQKFNGWSRPQQTYYQPSQPQEPYYRPSQPQQPYYQPSQPAQPQQSYEQGYNAGQRSGSQSSAYYTPPEQTPPMQQQ